MRSGLLTHTHTEPPVQGLCSLQDQRTGLCLCQSKITSPHRRAEATGHLQAKVKCSWCGHAKWVVFSKSKSCLHCPPCQILRVLYSCTTKSPVLIFQLPRYSAARDDSPARDDSAVRDDSAARDDSGARDDSPARDDSSAYESCTTKSPVLSF